MAFIQRFIFFWRKLVGSPPGFSFENIAFNTICIVTLIILGVLLPFNAVIGLGSVVALMVTLIVLLCVFYYFSRFKKNYKIGFISYAIGSYLTLICNFLFNSGSLGPTIFLFFLTFQLLIALTRKTLHPLWFGLHLLLPTILLLTEYFKPEWVPDTYASHQGRLSDLLSSYIVILVCMYWITIYLRNNYLRERRVVEEHAREIKEQHGQILLQNEKLTQLNEEKVKLFSVISHDLRSPLATAVGLAELLEEDASLDDEERALFQKELTNVSKNALEMLTNLLSWSSAQMGGVTARLKSVDMGQVIEKVVAHQNIFAQKKGIRIFQEMKPGIMVAADFDMMKLIVRNLLHNAIKFTHPAGSIWIEDEIAGDTYMLRIKDSGIGMTQAQLDSVFSLKTVSTYGTGNEKGTGLGLHLCKEFIELQNGTIQVDSEQGKGSTFSLQLPLVKENV